MNEPQKNYNLLKAIQDIYGTQDAFARNMRLNTAHVSMAVNGLRVLTIKEKRDWAKALKTTIGYLWPDPE